MATGNHGDAPPTYEESLQHPRVDDTCIIPLPNYAPPEYSAIHYQDHGYSLPAHNTNLEQYHNVYDTFAYVPPTNRQQARSQATRVSCFLCMCILMADALSGRGFIMMMTKHPHGLWVHSFGNNYYSAGK